MDTRDRLCFNLSEVLECLHDMQRDWSNFVDLHNLSQPLSLHSPPTAPISGPGRPSFDISRERLQYLRSMNFTWSQIADTLGVSYMTIYRRRRDFGIMEDPGGNVSDSELCELLQQMKQDFPSLVTDHGLGTTPIY